MHELIYLQNKFLKMELLAQGVCECFILKIITKLSSKKVIPIYTLPTMYLSAYFSILSLKLFIYVNIKLNIVYHCCFNLYFFWYG